MYRPIFPLCLLFTHILICYSCQPAPSDTPLFEGQDLNLEKRLETIAIGSCNRQDEPQAIWDAIRKENPDLWIWLGDNIYGDTENMDVMLAKYQRQKGEAAYRRFRKEVPVIGIWDDHDYGVNDGGKEYPQKEASSSLLLDFLDVPKEAEVRKREGVYQSYTFGPEGEEIKIILLDTRYFRDPLEPQSMAGPRYYPNPEGDILGEAQWRWLEQELTNSDAQIHLIGTSIQLIPEEQFFEKWANFPAARDRFFRLLEKTKPSRPVLISGDRHISELSRIELPALETPLYELTSSGMTHTWGSAGEEPNRYRVGELIISKAFGLIRIDWSGAEPSLRVLVKKDNGQELLSRELN